MFKNLVYIWRINKIESESLIMSCILYIDYFYRYKFYFILFLFYFFNFCQKSFFNKNDAST